MKAMQGFDPEGAGYDHQTANQLKQMFPLTVPRPQGYQGNEVFNDGAFDAWIWHPEFRDIDNTKGGYLKHSSSRDPRTGMMLKGRQHDTFQQAVDADLKLGYAMQKGEGGRYYSRKIRAGDLNPHKGGY